MIFILLITTAIAAQRGWRWWSLLPLGICLVTGGAALIIFPEDQGMALDVLGTATAIVATIVMAIAGKQNEV